MTTEARLRRNAFLANALVAWYSFSLIVFSLMDLSKQFTIKNFSLIAATVSIAILAISLFVSGERYGEKADAFKACYLKLQRIYQSESSESEKLTQYADVLDFYENQSDADYDEMLFDAKLRGQTLINALGPISISFVAGFRVFIKRALRYAIISLIFLMPVIFGIIWASRT